MHNFGQTWSDCSSFDFNLTKVAPSWAHITKAPVRTDRAHPSCPGWSHRQTPLMKSFSLWARLAAPSPTFLPSSVCSTHLQANYLRCSSGSDPTLQPVGHLHCIWTHVNPLWVHRKSERERQRERERKELHKKRTQQRRVLMLLLRLLLKYLSCSNAQKVRNGNGQSLPNRDVAAHKYAMPVLELSLRGEGHPHQNCFEWPRPRSQIEEHFN